MITDRKIKFRGMLKEKKIWVYGNFVYLRNVNKSFIIDENTGEKYEVRNNSVGEFTGIYDKYGREVYEGDIIKLQRGEDEMLMTVQFRDGYFGFGGTHLGTYYFDSFDSEMIEIVNYIYNGRV